MRSTRCSTIGRSRISVSWTSGSCVVLMPNERAKGMPSGSPCREDLDLGVVRELALGSDLECPRIEASEHVPRVRRLLGPDDRQQACSVGCDPEVVDATG